MTAPSRPVPMKSLSPTFAPSSVASSKPWPARLNRPASRAAGFTLLELLTVIAIVGIVAAIAMPALRGIKPNPGAAASRQLLDAVTRARQLAISTRSTVYMVFVPPAFWTDQNYGKNYTPTDTTNAQALIDKQMVGYAYLSLRSVGDQPGMSYPRYYSSWRTLPPGAFVSETKFNYNNTLNPASVLDIVTNGQLAYRVYGFNTNNIFPFPSEQTPSADGNRHWISLPYIGFDAMGQLVSGNSSTPEYIPITEGSVSVSRDPNTKVAIQGPINVREAPVGNTSNNYNLVYIDQLTGRSRIEHMKVQ